MAPGALELGNRKPIQSLDNANHNTISAKSIDTTLANESAKGDKGASSVVETIEVGRGVGEDMRGLKMGGLNGKGKKKGSTSVPLTRDGNLGSIDGFRDVEAETGDKKDLKATESNDSGPQIEEVDQLNELRSDDDLLEDGNARTGASSRNRTRPRIRGRGAGSGDAEMGNVDGNIEGDAREYKVYKRRWFGLVQLVLLNIIVSWDWLSFAANSTTATQYYNISSTELNWISTSFLFSFVVASPIAIYTLHHGGPKPAIVVASILILIGNWIRYGATVAGSNGHFPAVMFGQILIGIAQPFVLSAPTRYSDLWFTNTGRVTTTAVMSLANPFGGALAQLIDPFWAGSAEQIPNMVLYISIIATIASIPSFFIPAKPPTPPSPSGYHAKEALLPSLRILIHKPEAWMIVIPFFVYVGLFNSLSSLVNQILQPYSFTETSAGIAGALLIVVGLVASAITSPIIDRTKTFVLAIKIQIPIVALSYLVFTFAPQTRATAAPFIILAVLGAASFSLVPVVLEYIIEITHPVSPEVTSTICWTGGQLLGGIFIIVSDVLRDPGANDGSADDGSTRPPGNMYRALVMQTVLAMVVMFPPLTLGWFGRLEHVGLRRVEADKEAARNRDRDRERERGVEEGNGRAVLP